MEVFCKRQLCAFKQGKFGMKRFAILLGLLFSFQVTANCTYGGSIQTINFPMPSKILADDSIPAGTVLAVQTYGGNVSGMRTTSNCAATDVYAVEASPSVSPAPGVTGIQGKPVYETGIKGIGFQISDATTGNNYRPVPAEFGTVPIINGGTSKTEQITVWLIKTKDPIDTSIAGPIQIDVTYRAGTPKQIQTKTRDALLLQVYLKLGAFNYRQTSCNISPGKSVINLPKNELSELIKAGKSMTAKKQAINLSINCPATSSGAKHIYWFNPITMSSSTTNGVLLNSVSPPIGAENVGFMIRDKDSNPIKFYNYKAYSFVSTAATQSINLTADYYITGSSPKPGKVNAIFEVIVQEE